MRIVKFRAWDKIAQTMCFVSALEFYSKYHTRQGILSGKLEINHTGEETQLRFNNEIVLMQWTGLYDANEIEVYEGDIVKLVKGNSLGTIRWNQQQGAFQLQNTGGAAFLSESYLLQYLVIGNIYEHPELQT